ncbi:MAG: Crp/Fnr family transcriptional regulator [Chitinophagaceae bacterium]|nr:Crp/Fnr family transcriptional regulator [Chitinophagaceae bacterium]
MDEPNFEPQIGIVLAINTDMLITWGANFRQYRKGEIIFKEDSLALFYHQIEEGSVKMTNCNEQGKEFIQGIFEAGDAFGEPPLFYEGVYPSSAVAETDCTIIRLRKESFMEILKDDPKILMDFTRTLCKRMHMKAIVSRELACYEPEHRIITMFDLYKAKHKTTENKRIKVPYTRQQIADMTGLRVETVIRTIRSLEQRGELKIESGKVYLTA